MERWLRGLVVLTPVIFGVSRTGFASATGFVIITGAEQVSSSGVSDTGTVTITLNGAYSETVSYGAYSTPASIASALAAKFALDCNAPTAAYAVGAQVNFKMRGGAANLQALTLSGTHNTALFQTASFPTSTAPGSVGSYGAPVISSLLMTTATPGSLITLIGINFGPSGAVTFNGIPSVPTSWNSTSITVPIPVGATTGLVVVTTFGMASNGVPIVLTSAVSCPIQ